MLKNGDILVGSGDGIVTVVKHNGSKYVVSKKQSQLKGAVTSIALRGEGHQFFAGTNNCQISR